MILGEKVLSDLEAETLPSSLQPFTTWGSTAIQTRLKSPISEIQEIKRRQLPLLALRNNALAASVATIRSEFQTQIAPHQSILNESCETESMDARIKESVEQIVWNSKSFLSPLNEQPYILSGLITWKTIIVPIISVIIPIVAIIIPFFILRLTQSEPISVSQYTEHVRQVLLKQISVPSMLRARSSSDTLGYLFETLFLALTFGSFITGLWNQIQSAIYLRTIVADLTNRGNVLRGMVDSTQRILRILKEDVPPRFRPAIQTFIDEGETAIQDLKQLPKGLTGFGTSWNDPSLFTKLRTWFGNLDAHLAISTVPNICFPRLKTGAPLRIHKLYHPSLPKGHRNAALFETEGRHVLLSGPNRGGKSTFCKSLGLSILYAQTWGIAWAHSMSFEPFAVFLTALAPTDVLGKLSLFEAEIEFAKHVLTLCQSNRTAFVMMDEIFHSTNAHDGISASRIFLKQLYGIAGVTSLISTHYRELITEFQTPQENKRILAWQMLATEKSDGTLNYLYKLADGISDKSSVMEILRERGLA